MDIQTKDGILLRNIPDGTPEEAIKARIASIRAQRQQPAPEQPKIQGGIKDSPVGGFLRGLRDIPDAGAQLLTRGLEAVAPAGSGFESWARGEREKVEGINKAAEQDYRKNWRGGVDPGLDVGRIGGNIAAMAPLAGIIPGAGAAKLGTRMASGAVTGASAGALQPTNTDSGEFWSEKAKQTSLGGILGGLAPAVLGGISRVVKPNTSDDVAALMREGVTPTPGQILGGVAKRAEEGLTSVPLVGDTIKSAQRRSVEDLNRAAFNRVLSPIGKSLPKGAQAGRETVAKVGDMVTQAYDDLLPKLNIQADKQFADDIVGLRNLANNMPDPQARQFNNILKSDVLSKFEKSGKMMGETMKEVESKLGRYIRQYGKSENPDHRLMSDAFREAQSALRKMVERANPEYSGELQKVNKAYANLLRVENAAGRIGAKEGVFSPAQLKGATRAMDSSLRKRAFARGDALMQDLAESGENVLGATVPDSGTPFRALMSAGPLGLFSTLATAPAALPYTKTGQKALATILAKRPEIAGELAQLIRSLGPAASLSAPAAYGLLGE